MLDNLAELGRLISHRLGVAAGEINRLSTFSLYQPDPPLSAVCLTVLANRMLSGQAVLQPLTVEDWERVTGMLFEQNPEAGFTPAGPKIFQHGYRLFADNGPAVIADRRGSAALVAGCFGQQTGGRTGKDPGRRKSRPQIYYRVCHQEARKKIGAGLFDYFWLVFCLAFFPQRH